MVYGIWYMVFVVVESMLLRSVIDAIVIEAIGIVLTLAFYLALNLFEFLATLTNFLVNTHTHTHVFIYTHLQLLQITLCSF